MVLVLVNYKTASDTHIRSSNTISSQIYVLANWWLIRMHLYVFIRSTYCLRAFYLRQKEDENGHVKKMQPF